MYERFYGLRERPFDLTLDPRFLFLSPQHHEALIHLKYGLSGRPGITLLIGDAGAGKSTLIRAALHDDTSGSRIATVANPTLTRVEFYDYLARAFGFTRDAAVSKSMFLAELQQALGGGPGGGDVLALIVDEAQSLPTELLEELRLLTNLEGENGRCMTLLLVGQPELAERLNDPSLRQLKQRVALRAHLTPFSLKESAGYIASRITAAGGRADLVFTRDAVLAIHSASRGLPRVISVLCDNALVSGFAAGIKPVGSAVIADVCADFDLPRVAVDGNGARQVDGNGARQAPAPGTRLEPRPSGEVPDRDPAVASSRQGSMFDTYQQQPKRFSFFKGSRR